MSYYSYTPPMMPMMPPMMPMMPMMPPMPPTLPISKGGKVQAIKNSVKPSTPPDITLYVTGLFFIIAAALIAAVSSGSATFAATPFDAIKNNSTNILNVLEDENLLINTTGLADQKDYTINVTQDVKSKQLTFPIINLESKTPLVNLNSYNSDDVNSSNLKGLKNFGPSTILMRLRAFTSTGTGSSLKKVENALVQSVYSNQGIDKNSSLNFAVTTPTAQNVPQTNLVISNLVGTTGQFTQSISKQAYSHYWYNQEFNAKSITQDPIIASPVILNDGDNTLEVNKTYYFKQNLNGGKNTLPSTADIGDSINIFLNGACGANQFNNPMYFVAPDNTNLGIGSIIEQRTMLTPDYINSYSNNKRFQILNQPKEAVKLTRTNDPSSVELFSVVLKFTYLNCFSGETFKDSSSFTQGWITHCYTLCPNATFEFTDLSS